MSFVTDRMSLLLWLQRGLLGEVHPQLRQASIEADSSSHVVRLRFEYDGEPAEAVKESCSCAATEIIAAFPSPWQLDDQHVSVPFPAKLRPLQYVGYARAESRSAT